MNEEELRREIIRENRTYDGRIEQALAGNHRLRYPYLYPLGDDEEDESDDDEA